MSAAIASAAWACGSFTADDTTPADDAGLDGAGPGADAAPGDGAAPGDAGAIVDAADAPEASAARCDPSKPFGTPTHVFGLPSNGSGVFRLTADESHAYYENGDGGLFRAEVLAVDEVGPGTPITVSTSFPVRIVSPTLSDDEKTLFFEQGFQVWHAVGKPGGPYGVVESSPVFVGGGQPSFDEPGGFLYAVFYVDGGLFNATIERAPSDGGSTGGFVDLGFGPTSNAQPTPGPGGLYYALRTQDSGVDVMFAPDAAPPGAAVANVNSSWNDAPLHVTRDGCVMYLATNRGTFYQGEVFVAQRPR